jgi:opacity protein-like surface antigen
MPPRLALCIFAILLTAAPRAFSQEYSPLRWYIMGGANMPLGNTGDILQSGYNVGLAVTWREPGHPLGVRLDFNYSANDATRALLNQGSAATGLNITGGWADIWSASLNLEAQHLFSSTSYGYLIGGIGAYYTQVQLTQYGYGYVCDPWWGYCYNGSGNVVVASNSSTKFGWNGGVGMAFRLQGPTLFIEARYTRIETSPQPLEFVPITIGLRF